MTFLIASPNAGLGFVLFVLGILIYFIPSYVAYKRKKSNKVAILMLNIFLGWTLIGWVVALVWATANEKIDHPNA